MAKFMLTELIYIEISNLHVQVNLSLWLLLALSVLLALYLFLSKGTFIPHADVELNVNLGAFGSIIIKPNTEVRQIAYNAWVELKTRKAGLPIDKERDVIIEIYTSWYELFTELRRLLKNIPASKLSNPETKKLVNLMVESLNEGLRPHLTEWHAKYARWYQEALENEKNHNLTPQQIQRKYPEYDELLFNMLDINKQLVSYTAELEKLAITS